MSKDPSQPGNFDGPEDCELDLDCFGVPECVTEAVECATEIAIGLLGINCLLYKQGEELNANPDTRWGDSDGFYPTTRKRFNRLVECERTGEMGDTVTKSFEFTLKEAVLPGTVRVFVGRFDCPDFDLKDDGEGVLIGDGEGKIDYKTGLVRVKFNGPPALKVLILSTYRTESPIRTKVWIEQPEWLDLRNTDGGFMQEETQPLRAYFRPRDEVRSGDWIDLPTDFSLRGRDFRQLEVVGREYKDLRRQTLTAYLMTARREHR